MELPPPHRPAPALSPALRLDVERWFIQRGVPQLIDDYRSESAMDARAAPYIAAWLLVGSALLWATRPDRPNTWNSLSVAGMVAFIAVAFFGIRWLRGRPLTSRNQRFDVAEIALLGILVAVPTGLIHASVLPAISAGLNALLGIGAIYLIIGFGLLEIASWAGSRLRLQLGQIARLVASTLPLLLILVVFLLFSAEIWEAAHVLAGIELAAVLVLLLIVGVLLIVTKLRPELRLIETQTDWSAVVAEATDTPVAQLATVVDPAQADAPRLRTVERTNVTLVVVVDLILQAIFVGSMVMAFLVAFGLIALPASVQMSWIGEPVGIVAQFELLGEARTLSSELLTVTAMLSGIVALYFTGLALTDPTYRTEHFTRSVQEVREILAVRALYVTALRRTVAAAPPDG